MSLEKYLSPNLSLHAAIEKDSQSVGYGEITYTVMVKNGKADMGTLSTVIRKRKKY